MKPINKEQVSIQLIQKWYKKNRKYIFMTTSCGATSSVLIDLVYKSKCQIPIIFIDTRFLFKETLKYFIKLKDKYKSLEFIVIKNNDNNKKYYNNKNGKVEIIDVEKCCLNNKTKILNLFIKEKEKKCWISAIRKEQNNFRELLESVEFKEDKNLYKISPILDWTDEEIKKYISVNKLPMNSLVDMGYESIGCEPCTIAAKSRDGRWANKEKKECGLHL